LKENISHVCHKLLSCPLVTDHSPMYVQDAEIRSSNSGRVGTYIRGRSLNLCVSTSTALLPRIFVHASFLQ
jgi:hypothetical protein